MNWPPETSRTAPRVPATLWPLASAGLAGLGTLAFLWGLAGADSQRAWLAYLVNFVFWLGLSAGALMFSATLTITNARWGRPLKRLAEGLGTFVPAAFLLFWPLYFGRMEIFPWITEPVPKIEAWLNVPALFIRDGLCLLVLAAAGVIVIRRSVRRDLTGTADEASLHRDKVVAIVYGLLFAFLLSVLSVDLIMSLHHDFFSTLFPAWYFSTSFYSGLGAVAIAAAVGVRAGDLGPYIQERQFHALGKLVLAFCVFCAYLSYIHLLLIWYANIPEETEWLLERVRLEPFAPLAWVVLALVYAIPFVVLLRRSVKMNSVAMALVAAVLLSGLWIERFLLIVPSPWKHDGMPLGWMELSVTLGFLGIVGLCSWAFLRRVPKVPVGDPLFQECLRQENRTHHG